HDHRLRAHPRRALRHDAGAGQPGLLQRHRRRRPGRRRGDRALSSSRARGGGHSHAPPGAPHPGDLMGGKGFDFGLIGAFAAFAAFPFLWMLITMFKQTNDLLDPNHNPFLYEQPPTLENLRVLFEETYFVQWIANTLLIGVLVVLITLCLAVPAGYSL